ncbi:ATP-binding protein [Streptomyces sp. NPDC006660]|uniref:ATP-binding protein n=1 Tax=Streptomyces sp. NPDC006660 TaxID=3156901 RepID=UPI0033CDA68F
MNQESSTQLPAPARHFSVLLSSTPRGARLARILAVSWLRDWHLAPGVIDAAEHVVAELASNAVTHGRHPGRNFRLAFRATRDALHIEVTDTRGDDLPRRRPPSPGAESGRGLILVEAFADRWGVSLGPVPRKTVWAEIDLLPPHPPAGPEHGGPCSGPAGHLL